MADQEVVIDDREMFQSAMADEPQETAESERARDEQGRFVAKEPDEVKPEPAKAVEVETKPEVKPEEVKTEEAKEDANVPSWRLREVREAREAAERRAEEATRSTFALNAQIEQMRNELAQLRKPKEERIDFFSDPDQALQQRLSPVEERFAKLESEMRLNTSRAIAVATHGADAVKEMEAAIEKAMQTRDPDVQALAAQLRSSHDPVAVAMQWHQKTKLLNETGGDIGKYKEKILADAMKDPAFQAKVLESARAQAGQQTTPKVIIPPSLNKASGSGNASQPDDLDVSDAALFRNAMGSRR